MIERHRGTDQEAERGRESDREEVTDKGKMEKKERQREIDRETE